MAGLAASFVLTLPRWTPVQTGAAVVRQLSWKAEVQETPGGLRTRPSMKGTYAIATCSRMQRSGVMKHNHAPVRKRIPRIRRGPGLVPLHLAAALLLLMGACAGPTSPPVGQEAATGGGDVAEGEAGTGSPPTDGGAVAGEGDTQVSPVDVGVVEAAR